MTRKILHVILHVKIMTRKNLHVILRVKNMTEKNLRVILRVNVTRNDAQIGIQARSED